MRAWELRMGPESTVWETPRNPGDVAWEDSRKVAQSLAISRLLERRWGRPSTPVDDRLPPSSSERLDSFAEAQLDLQSPAHPEAWLRNS